MEEEELKRLSRQIDKLQNQNHILTVELNRWNLLREILPQLEEAIIAQVNAKGH